MPSEFNDIDYNTDYYKILGVDSTASIDVIKQEHVKLALKFHPDTSAIDRDSPEAAIAAEHFKLIQNAYSILSKSDLRARYDSVRGMTSTLPTTLPGILKKLQILFLFLLYSL